MNWSWLLTLACPLMMIFMMFGMKGSHSHGAHRSNNQPSMKDVQDELHALKMQNELMRQEIQSLKN
ncbi:DUF2933 domain-containing protein [Paenibacillus sp. sgz500958]|uniref:DUF2933 domain-containing protein n=1 Tax=Paenibacillus sp. sgz500958 TaxID=3242475 RepID=UPI0036D3AE05